VRAIVVGQHGGPEVMLLDELPDPRPGPGQVLVEIAAVGVNYYDIYERSGLYERTTPFTPGREAAGIVIGTGRGVTGFTAGDRVASADFVGAYAERALASAERLVRVPAEVSLDNAAAVLLQGLTAHYLTQASYPVRPGDSVLVHAAAGGTGLLLTQMVRLRDGRVIGTVSTAEKEKLAREAGADEVIRYSEADFPAEVRRLTGGQGVPVAYDGVGRATFDGSLASLRPRGTLVLFGQASGKVPPIDPGRLAAGSLCLTRPMLPDFIASQTELLCRGGQVFDWVGGGQLNIYVGRRYELAAASAAHADLEQRRTTGKLLLVP
jgi:NADPH:quinone reductase